MKKLSKMQLFKNTVDLLKGDYNLTEEEIKEMIKTYEEYMRILEKEGK